MPDIRNPSVFDLSVREPVDAMGLTRYMLDRVTWFERSFRPVIQPEVTPVTDSLLLTHETILYHCGNPFQPDWNVKAWVWRFALSLTVLGRDPERVHRICAHLNRQIALWPYMEATPYGKVGRIVDNPGFESGSSGDAVSSKSVSAWTSSKLIQAASPRG